MAGRQRCATPCPTLSRIRHTRDAASHPEDRSDYSWFILNQHIIRREFRALGSEQNPDLTNKSIRLVLGRAIGKRAVAPVESFKEHGADFRLFATRCQTSWQG
jgi:predicted oxidoreductase